MTSHTPKHPRPNHLRLVQSCEAPADEARPREDSSVVRFDDYRDPEDAMLASLRDQAAEIGDYFSKPPSDRPKGGW
jgi:hypothetical protein